MPEPTIHQRKGYRNRSHYLETLAEELDIPLSIVRGAAAMLGEGEDFDGLVSTLEDWRAEA